MKVLKDDYIQLVSNFWHIILLWNSDKDVVIYKEGFLEIIIDEIFWCDTLFTSKGKLKNFGESIISFSTSTQSKGTYNTMLEFVQKYVQKISRIGSFYNLIIIIIHNDFSAT